MRPDPDSIRAGTAEQRLADAAIGKRNTAESKVAPQSISVTTIPALLRKLTVGTADHRVPVREFRSARPAPCDGLQT